MPIILYPVFNQKRPSVATPSRILALHEAGASWRAIGRMYNISGERARQLALKVQQGKGSQ